MERFPDKEAEIFFLYLKWKCHSLLCKGSRYWTRTIACHRTMLQLILSLEETIVLCMHKKDKQFLSAKDGKSYKETLSNSFSSLSCNYLWWLLGLEEDGFKHPPKCNNWPHWSPTIACYVLLLKFQAILICFDHAMKWVVEWYTYPGEM